MKSTLLNMVMVLTLVTFVASTAVGYVYQLTKDPIAAAISAKTTSAIANVLPSFDTLDEPRTVEVDGSNVKIYEAKSSGQIVGYAVETFTKSGFGGEIKLMVGFDAAKKINNIAVISHNETPGLGDKILPAKSNFGVQFQGEDPASFKLSVTKDGGDVDAITASTITSRAYCDAVQRAYNVIQ